MVPLGLAIFIPRFTERDKHEFDLQNGREELQMVRTESTYYTQIFVP